MKTKLLRLLCLLLSVMLLALGFAACGDSDVEDDYYDDSYEDEYEEDYEDGSGGAGWLSDWVGMYYSDSGSLSIELSPDSEDMAYYLLFTQSDGSMSSGTLHAGNDSYLLQDDYLVFTYSDSDKSITVEQQDGSSGYEHFVGTYVYDGPPAGSDSDTGYDVVPPDSIDAWNGTYTGDQGTLEVSVSFIEDMVDYEFSANDGAYMSGTWKTSSSGIGVLQDSYITATYNVEDGSITIAGITEEDNESNASFIGTYYPS